MTYMTVTVLGSEEFQFKLRGVGQRATDMTPVMRLLRTDFRRVMARQFDSQGGELGTPWAQLADWTVRTKEREGLDPRILHASRDMRKSFTQGRGGVAVVSRQGLDIDVPPPAVFHQEGAGRVPQRIIFRFNADVKRRWTQSIADYVVRGTLRPPA